MLESTVGPIWDSEITRNRRTRRQHDELRCCAQNRPQEDNWRANAEQEAARIDRLIDESKAEYIRRSILEKLKADGVTFEETQAL